MLLGLGGVSPPVPRSSSLRGLSDPPEELPDVPDEESDEVQELGDEHVSGYRGNERDHDR